MRKLAVAENNEDLARRQQFRSVSDIARLLHEGGDLRDVLHRLTEGVCRRSNWSASSIQVLDLARRRTMPIVRFDPERPEANGVILEWDASGSPLQRIVETGKPLILPDATRQNKYVGFRDDARRRGYRTVVMFPLKFPDEQGRPIVFTVMSTDVVAVDASEMDFLQCLVDLADVAVGRMRISKTEKEEAERLHDIVVNLNTALTTTLDTDSESELFAGLSRLFPSGWFAIDLTTGRILHDATSASEFVRSISESMPETVIRAALKADAKKESQNVSLVVNDQTRIAQVRGLIIDGTRAGALFFPDAKHLGSTEQIAAQAGRLALSTFILRNYMVFKTRGPSARRLMRRLFAGELGDRQEIVTEARALGIDTSGRLRLISLQCGKSDGESEETHGFILGKFQSAFGTAISCVIDRTIHFLCGHTGALDDARQRDEFLRSIRPILSQKLTVVASPRLDRLSDISGAYDACTRNLQVADAMGAEGWLSNRQIGSFYALMSSVSHARTDEFLTETIGPLIRAASSKDRVMIETLEAYLATGRRPQETADRLGIHVSTLRYRLDRLVEAYALELTDADQCFELELALRLYRLRASYQK